MTKPRTRTHKIHRKRRGPRRGFKSRSQRGGEFSLRDFNPMNLFKTKDTDNKPLLGNGYQNSSVQPMTQAPVSLQDNTTYNTQDNTTYNPQDNTTYNPLNHPSFGGRRKRTRCKRHHKHSRRCKK